MPARARAAIRSSWNTSRKTKRRGSIRHSRYTKHSRQVLRTTWCRRFATFSAASSSQATTSTRKQAFFRAGSARASRWHACFFGRRIRCCWTNQRTISTSTRRTFSSKRWKTTAARSSSCRTTDTSSKNWRRKIIEIGHGEALVYPGTYSEFLWHKEHPANQGPKPKTQGPDHKEAGARHRAPGPRAKPLGPKTEGQSSKPPEREARKREDAERRKKQRAAESLQKRIADLEGRIAEREAQVKELEAAMSATGFYDNAAAAATAIDRHKALMWEVGDLMAQWEALQEHASES